MERIHYFTSLKEFVEKKVIGAELNKFDIVFMEPSEYPTIVSIDEVSELEIEDVSEMLNTGILFKCSSQCVG